MAISKSVQDKQTTIKLETAYINTMKLIGKLSKTKFAEIIGKKKQNIHRRISYEGFILLDEVSELSKFLAIEGKTDNKFYKTLENILNPVKSNFKVKEVKQDNNSDDDDYTSLKVRGEVGISCGYGTFVDNDNITGECVVPTQTLRKFGANRKHTEIVYAQGDSMSPEIKSGDALLVDTSQTDVIDGVVYAFNYDGQPMCKRLRRIGQEITAISTNPIYEPFSINFSTQFNVIGRVVGFIRPVL